MGRVVGALLACVVVLLTGCTAEGEPSAPEPPAPAPPQRSREVPIDGVDPCSLLTAAQRAELGFSDRAVGDVQTQRLYDDPVPTCVFEGLAPRHTTVGVGLVVSNGVERFAADDVDADVRQIVIQRFPAVAVVPRRYDDYCILAVDVAPRQLVEVVYRDVALPPPIPQDELCRNAEQVADAAMSTLLVR